VGDLPDRLGEHRHAVAHVRRRLAGALAGDGPDPHRAVLPGDGGELVDAVDVDEDGRRREPGVHQPDEALAARERPGFGAVLREVGQCLVHAPRSEIGERGRFHYSTPLCAGV
jgi:hypothetical protein